MPISAAPAIVALKESPVGSEKIASHEHIPFGDINLERWSVIGAQASRDAQAKLHKKGLSYFIGRDGIVMEVRPNGEEVPCVSKP